MKHLLLVSSSKVHGGGYLDHCEAQVRTLFGDAAELLFVPYALCDHSAYATAARTRFGEWLVPFQINPHYIDPDPESIHMGETRDQRLFEFHEENDGPVVALREGAMLEVRDERVELLGEAGGKLFVRGEDPRECAEGTRLDGLVDPES
jgi:peptidase E